MRYWCFLTSYVKPLMGQEGAAHAFDVFRLNMCACQDELSWSDANPHVDWPRFMLVTGKPGTGKTHVLNAYIDWAITSSWCPIATTSLYISSIGHMTATCLHFSHIYVIQFRLQKPFKRIVLLLVRRLTRTLWWRLSATFTGALFNCLKKGCQICKWQDSWLPKNCPVMSSILCTQRGCPCPVIQHMPIMLLENCDKGNNYINGQICQVLCVYRVTVVVWSASGNVIKVYPVTTITEHGPVTYYTFTSAYAYTIAKVQGQTLQKIILYRHSPIQPKKAWHILPSEESVHLMTSPYCNHYLGHIFVLWTQWHSSDIRFSSGPNLSCFVWTRFPATWCHRPPPLFHVLISQDCLLCSDGKQVIPVKEAGWRYNLLPTLPEEFYPALWGGRAGSNGANTVQLCVSKELWVLGAAPSCIIRVLPDTDRQPGQNEREHTCKKPRAWHCTELEWAAYWCPAAFLDIHAGSTNSCNCQRHL